MGSAVVLEFDRFVLSLKLAKVLLNFGFFSLHSADCLMLNWRNARRDKRHH